MTGGVIKEVGSTAKNKTGGWRSQRPMVDAQKCRKCGICVQHCPEPCITLAPTAIIDYDYCKGCLICKSVCPFGAITSGGERACRVKL
jgi:2-oxoacid:acceptor oxidoreductase delta subunit (pyruvate/2-ketoisovalerate family)